MRKIVLLSSLLVIGGLLVQGCGHKKAAGEKK